MTPYARLVALCRAYHDSDACPVRFAPGQLEGYLSIFPKAAARAVAPADMPAFARQLVHWLFAEICGQPRSTWRYRARVADLAGVWGLN